MRQINKIIGVFLIVLGILFNEYLLENFFSTFAIAKLNSKISILIVEFILITLGILFLVIRFKDYSFNKIKSYYKKVAVFFFSFFLLVFFIIQVVKLTQAAVNIFQYKDQILLKDKDLLKSLYPTFKVAQIKELMRETWSRPFIYEPYTQFKERAYNGDYVNVSENGFRYVKNQGPWPPDLNNFNIFLFGGSATFNYGVSDEQTIASYLQELLTNAVPYKRFYVYNFGRGYYFSTQERILFEKLLCENHVPALAVFIDGFNDFYYDIDEPLFTRKLESFINRNSSLLNAFFLMDIVNSLSSFNNSRFSKKEEDYNNGKIIKSVMNRYLNNKRLIEAIAKEFKIKTLFVWQPAPTYKYDLKYYDFAKSGFGRFMYSKYGYSYAESIKDKLGNNFLWLADIQEGVNKSLYVEVDHYSPEMSQEIAINIYNFLMKHNLLK